MHLAMFDLDQTLIAGDSDHLWGQFLADRGIVDSLEYNRKNDQFYQEYREGRLNIHEFSRFALHPLSQHPMSKLEAWRQQFIQEYIQPKLLPAAFKLVNHHRNRGDILLIITATNSFVTAPIAQLFGINNLLATEPELHNGRYTGAVAGIPCFREGKVAKLQTWLKSNQNGDALQSGSTFYSDSHNDLPLLNWVTEPVAVDPDPMLKNHAIAHNWPIISLRTN